MNDPSRWSLDQDPPRDEALARLLRAADEPAPGADVDWERLHARHPPGPGAGRRGRVGASGMVGCRGAVARGSPLAASAAAILAAAALLWRTDSTGSELSLTDAAPESAALARVVAAYPDEAVFDLHAGGRPQRRVHLVGHPMSELRRSRLVAGVVIVLVLLAGVAIGFFLHHAVPWRHGPPGFGVGGPPPGRPPEVKKRMLERLDRDLKLTPDQHARIDTVLTHREADLRA